MSSDAKASTAGSNQRRAKGLGRIFGGALATRHASSRAKGSGASKAKLLVGVAASLALVLALAVGSASGATTRLFVEVFGSSAQPAFPGDRGMAVDQATGELYVLDASEDAILRFNANGTPSNFAALGSNAIDGEGTGDETPDGNLDFPSSRKESQIAIDESGGATDGNIYVVERGRDQITIFSSEGEYIGQLSEHSGGAFSEPLGVTVDEAGNVYVGDFSSADLVHKYEPSGNPPVNGDNVASFNSLEGTSSPGILAAGMGATNGFLFVTRFNGELFKLDSSTGELKYQLPDSGVSTVSVDPTTGHVFAARNTGTGSTIDEYDASGASEASLVSSFKPGSTAEGVAVNGAAEEVYVSRSSTENVEVYGAAVVVPDVTTEAPSSNTGTRATLAGTVNPDGVELDECFFEWGLDDPNGPPVYGETVPCAETPAEIGAGTSPVAVHADLTGLVPQGEQYEYRLVAVNPNATINGSNKQFTTPDTVTAEAATGLTPTEATLNGSVNPDTATITECVFEWGKLKAQTDAFQAYPETAPCVPSPGSGTSPVAVAVNLSGLHPGTTYAYRLKATYPTGAIVTGQKTVQTTGPVIAATWAEGVVFSEAVLKTEINPEGSATTYHIEYGPSEAYGSETEELNVGSDSSAHELTRFFGDLTPGATYHYRVVASNSVATNEGPDRAFTTYAHVSRDTSCSNQALRVGPAASLPDCRAYEMVSPIEKNGNEVGRSASDPAPETTFGSTLYAQSSITGEKLAYSAFFPFADAESAPINGVQYVATRSADGWKTHGVTPPRTQSVYPPSNSLGYGYKLFSPDLANGWMTYDSKHTLTDTAPVGFAEIYRRDNTTETYEAINQVTPPATPPNIFEVEIGGVSSDGRHVVFSAKDALTADAPAIGPNKSILYDSHQGDLHLVSVLPGGEPSETESFAGTHNTIDLDGFSGTVDHAVSDDGSRIFWTATTFVGAPGQIFVRIDNEETVPVSESVSTAPSQFWAASPDGSTALFGAREPGIGSETSQQLYEFDVDSETPTLIASKTRGVLGASDDLSYIYFVSEEVLDSGATGNARNLYVRHNGTVTFIATLGSAETSLGGVGNVSVSPISRTSRVTPDGRHLAFMSGLSLTGYDNIDAENRESDEEIFLYDADTGELTCSSCNPSGQRPIGGPFKEVDRQVAAKLATWENQLYAPNALTADGNRLFFASFDALLPQDTNGKQDVYQWERNGTGTCDEAEGCISLLSTGESPHDSEFLDATADGDTIFINTSSSIAPGDPGLRDVYAVRVGGGYPSPVRIGPCSGDTCQSPSEPPGAVTPASAGFRGEGNPAPVRNCGAQAKRAAKLSSRAKRLRRHARHAVFPKRASGLRRRSSRLARRAKALSKRATRCRRANRRARR